MQILLGKGWWQEPTGSSRCFPGVICRGTRRNRVSIVIHFGVCGAERGRETGFPFLSALEVFRRSQVPLLQFKYSLSSLGAIDIFTAFPSAPFPLLMRFTLFGHPTTAIDLYSMWGEVVGCTYPTKRQKRCREMSLELSECNRQEKQVAL